MDFTEFTPRIRKETEILFEMYNVAIKNIAKNILRDDALAEDCLQDVMLKIAANLENIGEYGSLQAKAYIFRITRNHAIDIWRTRRHEVTGGLIPEGKPYGAERRADNDVKVGKYGFDESLDRYLDNLNDTDRAIVGMKYGLELKNREIARALGKTVASVDKRSERIKAKVKVFIAEGMVDEEE